MCGGEFGSQRREKKKRWVPFLKCFSETGGGGVTESQSGTAILRREHSRCSFFFLFLFFSSQVGKEETDEEGKEEIVLPEFIVAGCGRTIGRVFTEKERQREVTKGGEKRRREGEQQFD